MPADKRESFMQVDSITLDLPSRACPNYPTKFIKSLQYFKEKMKGEVDFLHVDKPQRFFQIDAIILGVCGQAFPNYPK